MRPHMLATAADAPFLTLLYVSRLASCQHRCIGVMMTHEECLVPSWFPSFLETQVESANLQFCHQARAPGAQIFYSFPLSDWVLDEENATFLLPFPSFRRACCRQENVGTRGKERMTLSILCFCGMPKMSVKSLWGTLSLISLFESAFAKWERMLTQMNTLLLASFDDWRKHESAWILLFPVIVGTQLHVSKRLSTWWRPNDSWRIHCALV
jgi:hypothetical protein